MRDLGRAHAHRHLAEATFYVAKNGAAASQMSVSRRGFLLTIKVVTSTASAKEGASSILIIYLPRKITNDWE